MCPTTITIVELVRLWTSTIKLKYIEIARFGKLEPKDRYIKWKIQTATNGSKIQVPNIKIHEPERRRCAEQKH